MYTPKEIIEILNLVTKKLYKKGDITLALVLEDVAEQLEEKIK